MRAMDEVFDDALDPGALDPDALDPDDASGFGNVEGDCEIASEKSQRLASCRLVAMPLGSLSFVSYHSANTEVVIEA